jgi:site-specific recombinase XerD
MNKQVIDLDELTSCVLNYLEHELCRTVNTVMNYKRLFEKLKRFIVVHDIDLLDNTLDRLFLQEFYGGKQYSDLSESGKLFYNCIDLLREYFLTGQIARPVISRQRCNWVLNGPIGELMEKYMVQLLEEERMKKATSDFRRRMLFLFLNYCNNNQINDIKNVDLVFIVKYLGEYNSLNKNCIYQAITALKSFFKYLYEQKIIDINYSSKVPRFKRVEQPYLPTVFSKEIVAKFISSIDRSSKVGKRDYAIALLLTRLGIRASDVANLKFDHLNWDKSIISFKQTKTGVPISLPLLPDVGNAIIDYLHYGRTKNDAPYVFLGASYPYNKLHPGSLSGIVKRLLIKGRIYVKGKRLGAHTLRHSLSSRMLENDTILPVISEVLGHSTMETTKYYIRIDIKSMMRCILDVPSVETSFYIQKGGVFYE